MAVQVFFLTVEDGDDLIVSFGLGPHATRSLTLLRTPKFESMLPPEERGVSVGDGLSDDAENELLVSVQWSDVEIAIHSTRQTYVLDVHAVAPQELREAKAVLRKMNFDQRFVVSGV